MERPDALVHQCRNVAKMEDGPVKDEFKRIALDLLSEYEQQGRITRELRVMLETIIGGGQPPPDFRRRDSSLRPSPFVGFPRKDSIFRLR